MSLDIEINTDADENIFTFEYITDKQSDYFNKHNLSRTFCNFICRRNVTHREPELDQIGKITRTDISVFYEMESYPSDEYLSIITEYEEDELEKRKMLEKAHNDREKLKGNINIVLSTVNTLIEKLSIIGNLPLLLAKTDDDTIGIDAYFSDFNIDKGEGYIGNNFGHDLRNFKRFVEFAKEKGAKTVFFT